MSTAARDKATSDALAQFQLAGQYVGSREADALLYGAGYGFDAGRASVLSALTVERIADEVAHWPIGSGYYQTSIGTDEAREIARAVLALIEQETGEQL